MVVFVGDVDVFIKVVVLFLFECFCVKLQQIDFGKVVEQVNIDVVSWKVVEVMCVFGVELVLLVQGLCGNLSVNMVLGVGLVDLILSMSGVCGWFNKLVLGDE